ncbi:MAG: transporter substrate-binding domain-containing protein [Pseudomonadota bacterium]
MRFAYLIEPPFNYIDSMGRLTGCDIELARFVSNAVGSSDFRPVETEFPNLLPGLAAGEWDMTTGMFATPARRQLACFSSPIWALPDGLLVSQENPDKLRGYTCLAANRALRLAVVRDQVQHETALAAGVSNNQILVFASYEEAADAVSKGHVTAYASVARAHAAFVHQHPGLGLSVVDIPPEDAPQAAGSFALSLKDPGLRDDVNRALFDYLGTKAHRDMMRPFGFSDQEIDLIA